MVFYIPLRKWFSSNKFISQLHCKTQKHGDSAKAMVRLLMTVLTLGAVSANFCGGLCPTEWYIFGLCGWLCGSAVFEETKLSSIDDMLLPQGSGSDVDCLVTTIECPPCAIYPQEFVLNQTTSVPVCDVADHPKCTYEACDTALCLRSELVYSPLNETLAQDLFTLLTMYNIQNVVFILTRAWGYDNI